MKYLIPKCIYTDLNVQSISKKRKYVQGCVFIVMTQVETQGLRIINRIVLLQVR